MSERGSGGAWRFAGVEAAPRRSRPTRPGVAVRSRRPRGVLALVETLSTMMAVREVGVAEHAQRVATVSLIIADELEREWHLGEATAAAIARYASLHDIGMQGVPDTLLLKPGRLTDDETLVARAHVRIGVAMADALRRDLGAAALPNFGVLRAIIAHHHERLDGSGYPDGLVGSDIPLPARIVAVADSLDAAADGRSGRPARRIDDVLDELAGRAGTLYDPDCVVALLRRRVALHLIYGEAASNAPVETPARLLAADAPTFGSA